jgi:hypothetical protein
VEILPEYLLFDQLRQRYEKALRDAEQLQDESERLRAESRKLMRKMQKLMDDQSEERDRERASAR